ncbi:MAG: hypothetical protein ACERKN_16370 [Velocimicrobium sp.]
MDLEKKLRQTKRILKIGILLLILFAIMWSVFLFVMRLEKPVFLKQYVEQYGDFLQDGSICQLNYISNIYDKRNIVFIDFPECNGLTGYDGDQDRLDESQQMDVAYLSDQYVCYQMRYFPMKFSYTGDDDIQNIILTRAIITYDNGETQEIELGSIRLLSNENYENSPYEIKETSSSNTGETSQSGYLNETIELRNLTSKIFEDVTEDFFHIKVGEVSLNVLDYKNGFEALKGVKIGKGTKLIITAKVAKPTDIQTRFTTFEVCPMLSYQDEMGNLYKEKINDIRYTPNIKNVVELWMYLKARGIK